MNIFAVDQCPIVSGSVLPDKVTVKMVLETAQMLSTAVRQHGYDGDDVYKTAHLNHPCSIWCRLNQDNFFWLYLHGIALSDEYTKRYGKVHKSLAIIERCGELLGLLPVGELTPHPQCMPDEFKHTNTQVAYKKYMASKSYFVGGFKKDVDHTEFYND